MRWGEALEFTAEANWVVAVATAEAVSLTVSAIFDPCSKPVL